MNIYISSGTEASFDNNGYLEEAREPNLFCFISLHPHDLTIHKEFTSGQIELLEDNICIEINTASEIKEIVSSYKKKMKFEAEEIEGVTFYVRYDENWWFWTDIELGFNLNQLPEHFIEKVIKQFAANFSSYNKSTISFLRKLCTMENCNDIDIFPNALNSCVQSSYCDIDNKVLNLDEQEIYLLQALYSLEYIWNLDALFDLKIIEVVLRSLIAKVIDKQDCVIRFNLQISSDYHKIYHELFLLIQEIIYHWYMISFEVYDDDEVRVAEDILFDILKLKQRDNNLTIKPELDLLMYPQERFAKINTPLIQIVARCEKKLQEKTQQEDTLKKEERLPVASNSAENQERVLLFSSPQNVENQELLKYQRRNKNCCYIM